MLDTAGNSAKTANNNKKRTTKSWTFNEPLTKYKQNFKYSKLETEKNTENNL
jgi:hypothetical protein